MVEGGGVFFFDEGVGWEMVVDGGDEECLGGKVGYCYWGGVGFGDGEVVGGGVVGWVEVGGGGGEEGVVGYGGGGVGCW